jgi:Cys-tRNA(Pro)/Cys-tRNA(Cys) deacylase
MTRGRSTRATETVRTARIDHDVLDVGRPRGDDRGFGLRVAEQLGVDPTSVFKTLITVVDQGHAVAVVPVTTSLDLKALAHACGARKAAMAEAAEAERLTGYVVGGISPLGQRRRLPTVLDRSACDHDRVFVSAGRRGLELALSPTDLAALTDAVIAAIGRRAPSA